MTLAMTAQPSLNDMVRSAMQSSLGRAKIAHEARRQLQALGDDDTAIESKVASAPASSVSTEYVMKLAEAGDYLCALLKEGAAVTEAPVGPGKGPGALPVGMTPEGTGPGLRTNTQVIANMPPMHPGTQKARPNDSQTQMENDDDHIPGSKSASAPVALLRKLAEGEVEVGDGLAQEEAAQRAARNSALLGAGAGGLGMAAGGLGMGALTSPTVQKGLELAEGLSPRVGEEFARHAPMGNALRDGLGAVGEEAGDLHKALSGVSRTKAILGGMGAGATLGATAAPLAAGAYMGGQADTSMGASALGALGGGASAGALGGLAGSALGAYGAASGQRGKGALKGLLMGGTAGGLAGAPLGGLAGVYGHQKADRALLNQAAGEGEDEKMSAPLSLLRKLAEDAANPARIHAGPISSTALPTSRTGEAGPPAEGKDRVPGTAEGVANFTRREAKSVPKQEMNALLDDPMMSAGRDNVLQQTFAHTNESGAKVASAQVSLEAARGILRNLANGGR